ncbi:MULTISPECIES: DUF6777 domain-containing protein [unclassified Streptomyces]|uniref:DUF6777 domain-containing protein n=1 Tax=unclassified Streptomyces TaxID=2593676 RepID=UPI0036E66BCA
MSEADHGGELLGTRRENTVRETTVRTFTGTFVTACALSAALIVAGCAGPDGEGTAAGGDVLLEPVAAQGPDPFTDSTATATATAAPVTRTQQPARSEVRSISGGTPGLYGGTVRSGSCEVNRQIGELTADRAKGRAFAQAAGISPGSIPAYLRSLTSVVLRADTRVTNHGYRDGHVTGYQSVLQAGTAVLVDNRGVPRVRCACGNPLAPARATHSAGTSGRPWFGYRDGQVVAVVPAPTVITHLTIIDVVDNTWIERRCGHDTRYDHVVPPPAPLPSTPPPTPDRPAPSSPSATGVSASGISPEGTDSPSATSESPAADPATPHCAPPTVTAAPGVPTPGDPVSEDPACPAVTVTATPSDGPTARAPSDTPETGSDTGPDTVPDTPDVPDGGGLIPDAPDEATTTGSIFDSPTAVLES